MDTPFFKDVGEFLGKAFPCILGGCQCQTRNRYWVRNRHGIMVKYPICDEHIQAADMSGTIAALRLRIR